MELLTRDTLQTLIHAHEPPCVSLYQPTHRRHPDNQQDPIRFKNLVRLIEGSLAQSYPSRETRTLLAPLQALATDTAFWNHTLDGLAVLAAPGQFRVFQLQHPVRELAVVADSFHVKPLLRVVQSADRYQVLCVTRQSARVFEGNRDALDQLESDAFPAGIVAALGDQRTEPHQTVASYGTGTGGPGPMYHGHGSRKDEVDKDTERYFRAVDRAMIAQFSKPSALPLVLAALPEHQSVFRQVSQNAALLDAGVEGDPESISVEQLRDAAWGAVESQYVGRLVQLANTFSSKEAHQQATSDLADAARAAIEGRVSHLLVEEERSVPGRIDSTTGRIDLATGRSDASMDDPDVGDVLDDLAEAVLRTGGDVVIVSKEHMPSKSGLAAILRY